MIDEFTYPKPSIRLAGTGLWRLKVGDWWQDCSSREEAMEALKDYREHRCCLYQGCGYMGEYMPQGFGFRFCPKHTREARKVMNTWSQPGRRAMRVSHENV